MVTFTVPPQLQPLAQGQKVLELSAVTLGEAFARLDEAAPMLRSQILDASGRTRRFVGLFVDGKQVMGLGDGYRPLAEQSRISVVLAVAGG